MMWFLLRHSLCVMLYRLNETINIFDITNAKEDEAHVFLKKKKLAQLPLNSSPQ